MKKILGLLLVPTLMFILFAGCGSKQKDSEKRVPGVTTSENMVGNFSIYTEKISFIEPLMIDDDFGKVFFAVSDDIYYILTDGSIKQYKLKENSLVYEKELPHSCEYDYIFTDDNGILYASKFGSDFSVFRDGEQIYNYKWIDRLTIHPSGNWGISWFVSPDVKVVLLSRDEIRCCDISYSELSILSSLNISQTHIIVAGITQSNESSAIFVYNKDDDSLELVIGGKEFDEPGYMSHVAAVVETKNGYMVLDSNMKTILFWASDGTYIDTIDNTDMFKTTCPRLCTAVLMPDGSIIIGMTDGVIGSNSTKEFMIYRITGF